MSVFVELSLILVLATVLSLIMRLVRQPLIVGYILTGILVGPYVLDLVHSQEQLELFSRIGISILLFIVGLTLNPDIAREVGKVSFITGLGQIVFSSAIGFFIAILLGFDSTSALYISVALTFSSTIIVLKLLADRGDMGKLYGKISIGFLLVQDVVATFVLLAVTIMGAVSTVDNQNLEGMVGELGRLFILGVFLVFLLYLLGKRVLPKIMALAGGNHEVLFVFSLAWGLGLASVFHLIGFSLEIGALLAGVILSTSSLSYEIGARMKPLRDFFILIFFILLGAQMVLVELGSIIVPAIILSVFVLVGNPVIVYLIMNILGYRNRTSFMSGLMVAQISEFSLILVALGYNLGHISRASVSLVTLVGLVTIAGSSYMILYADAIYEKLSKILRLASPRKKAHRESKDGPSSPEVIIFGYHRVGHEFVSVAEKITNNFLVVDYNPASIKSLEEKNVPCRFGDAEDIEFLDEIGFHQARLVVSTIPDHKTNLLLTRYYRGGNERGIIIITCHSVAQARELYNLGASYVVMPHYLGARHAARAIEENKFDTERFDRERESHISSLIQAEAFK